METSKKYMDTLRNGIHTIDEILKDTKGRVVGDSLADLSLKMVELVDKHSLFIRDEITGLCSSALSLEPDKTIPLTEARALWETFFRDRVKHRHVSISKDGDRIPTLKPLSQTELDLLWNNVYRYCTYNSRKQMYDDIPVWDGVERISFFLKRYFDCDTNPRFFLLFLTCIISKMDDPSRNKVDFFFDFCGDGKGTGKSTFCKHLLGKPYVYEGCVTARREDMYVNAYNYNALIFLDDECKMTKGENGTPKMSYDELKSFVTQERDIFTRKFQQPEEHDRAFVFVRTSNDPQTVYSPNERRQIIFNVGLPDYTCKHWQLSQDYMQQLLAEAKAYYVEHDRTIYKMTDEDWEDIKEQNGSTYNTETEDFIATEKFVKFMLNNTPEVRRKYLTELRGDDSGEWISWRGYTEFRKDFHEIAIDSRKFKRNLEVISRFWKDKLSFDKRQRYVKDVGTKVFVARILSGAPKAIVDVPNEDLGE